MVGQRAASSYGRSVAGGGPRTSIRKRSPAPTARSMSGLPAGAAHAPGQARRKQRRTARSAPAGSGRTAATRSNRRLPGPTTRSRAGIETSTTSAADTSRSGWTDDPAERRLPVADCVCPTHWNRRDTSRATALWRRCRPPSSADTTSADGTPILIPQERPLMPAYTDGLTLPRTCEGCWCDTRRCLVSRPVRPRPVRAMAWASSRLVAAALGWTGAARARWSP
jgi:hypothetical protein